MNVKILLDIDVDEEVSKNYKSKTEFGEDLMQRIILNELGNCDGRMVKIVKNKIIPYGNSI